MTGGPVLQIVSGMYFRRGVQLNETLHRAVFYTNGTTLSRDPVACPVGRLLFSSWAAHIAPVTVEAVERLEAVRPDGREEWLISTSGHALLDDLTAVLAFALNVSISRSEQTLQRLVPTAIDQRPLGQASNGLARTFDPQVMLSSKDFSQAAEFMDELLALERRYFEAALRAIHRVIDATLLVSDDPTTSYTMFVATLESLAQLTESPDDHDWTRYDDHKRRVVEESTQDLTAEQAAKVHDAVLSIDQLSLRRRFIAFTLSHIRPSFYRSEAASARQPVRSTDLQKALDFAYKIRSRNVHALEQLAPELYVVADRAETLTVDQTRALGLEALNRLCRHVIRTFVSRAPTTLDTTFVYRDHLPGVVHMRLDPAMWIGVPEGMTRKRAQAILDGFISVLIPVIAEREGAQLVDMRPVLEEAERLLVGENNLDRRRPLITLYILWHFLLGPEHHRPNAQQVIDKYSRDLDSPSMNGFVVRVLLLRDFEWRDDEIVELLDARRVTLVRQPDQSLPARLDAALMILGAQRKWHDDRGKALALLSQAVEFLPGDPNLLDLEAAAINGTMPEVRLRDFVVEAGEWAGRSQGR